MDVAYFRHQEAAFHLISGRPREAAEASRQAVEIGMLEQRQVVGFADITGTPANVSGAPVDFSSSSWVFGGAAVVGVTYFFDRSWFVDVSYTAGMTSKQAGNYAGPFYNPNGADGTTTLGMLTGNSSGRVITQAVVVTLNKAF